ncbi:MAG: glycoside hydrolase family 127 protein [Ruminococcus sp.]|nr:glycoside hydrolase family 127 protein [Ruminococcus sp.]
MLKPMQTAVTRGIFRERMDLNRSYLLELDPQCLLQNFYLEAGIIMPGLQVVPEPEHADLHWGWESPTCQLRGHFLGHWMSAAARVIASEKNAVLQQKLDFIVSELARCQQRNGGEWVGSIPEKYFDWMCTPDYIWSPQYTLHKTVMGLTDAYRYADNSQALEIVSRLADWYLKWTERQPDGIYKGEQGGMLEEWAELFALTGDEKYRTLIARYRDNYIYTKLMNESDALSDDHANASIPNIHGAARMYEITGDEHWKKLTETFWKQAVTERGMYATTGQNAGEFWIPPRSQARYLGANDQEFCTVYNMVRTADYLYRRTGDVQYADYIERALYNGFLAQQNRQTGMPAYFLPLGMGSRKKWGSKRHDFWCCHGTMIQAQTLYPELIAYADPEHDEVRIAQYIPSVSTLDMGGNTLTITLDPDMCDHNNQVFFEEHGSSEKSRWSFRVSVHCDKPQRFTLKLRVPVWAKGCTFLLDGSTVTGSSENGYISITQEWMNETLQIRFGSGITAERLPDQQELAAILEGPVVLAGLTDRDCGLQGEPADVLMPRTEHTYSTYPWKQSCFVTRDQPENFRFIPLYEVNDETYTVYFSLR